LQSFTVAAEWLRNLFWLTKKFFLYVQVLAHMKRYLSRCCRSRDRSNQLRMSPTSGLTGSVTVRREAGMDAGRGRSKRRPWSISWKRSPVDRDKVMQLQSMADVPSSVNTSPMIWLRIHNKRRAGFNFWGVGKPCSYFHTTGHLYS